MEHVTVHIFLPGTGQNEMFILPSDLSFREMLPDILSQMNALQSVDMHDCVICDRGRNAVIDMDGTAETTGVKNGTQLMLC